MAAQGTGLKILKKGFPALCILMVLSDFAPGQILQEVIHRGFQLPPCVKNGKQTESQGWKHHHADRQLRVDGKLHIREQVS